MKFTVCEQNSPAIKNLIDQYFVPWYVDVDASTQWYPYASGLGTFSLPLIAVIDPGDSGNYLDRSTGIQDADTFYNRLRNHADPSNDGQKDDTGSATPPEEAQKWLEAHNRYRAMHNVPPLGWSEDLARNAAQWAATCPGDHSPSAQNGAYGENIAWATYPMDPNGPVKLWYDEIELYDFNNQGFSHETGHFTQVVWKNTTQVGCALVEGCGNWQYTWVCQYAPPGNVSGQFEDNVFPNNSTEPGTPLTLSQNTLTLNSTDSVTISGGNSPFQALSSDTEIVTATVVNQEVHLTAVGSGMATVTVTDAQGATAILQVQVQIIAPAPLTLSQNTIELSETGSVTINDGYPPYSALSSNIDVVTASIEGHNLHLTAVSNGMTTVTVTDAQGAMAIIQVQVVQDMESPPIQHCPGSSLSSHGHDRTTATTFSGGISVAGGAASFHASVRDDTQLSIEVHLSIDPTDQNSGARLIVVAGIERDGQWFYYEKPSTEGMPWRTWHGNLDQLQGYRAVASLGEQQALSVFSGSLQGMAGTRLLVYAAYLLENGDIVFNSEPITITVAP